MKNLTSSQLELGFIAWVTPLIEEVKASARDRQCERSVTAWTVQVFQLYSTLPRVMEIKAVKDCGVGFLLTQEGPQRNVRHACETLVRKRCHCTEDRVDKGKALLHRIVSILTKLVMRFAPATEVREDVVRYNADDEDEDEYEDEDEHEYDYR